MNVPFIAGNWKMNGLRSDGLALARDLADWLDTVRPAVQMLICPPATLLSDITAMAGSGPLLIGAQDCHHRASGAHTGDICAAMLADAGASHVILGHSERRSQGEDSTLVAAKATAALSAGLCPLICIGETLAEREAGLAGTIVARQLRDSLPPGQEPDSLIIAYEPVWAIGVNGIPATMDYANARHEKIADIASSALGVKVPIVYGGSVNPGNCAELICQPAIDDGVLVGGASLKAADFKAIARAGLGGA